MDKHIDERWKDSVEKEKRQDKPADNSQGKQKMPPLEADFASLISSMAMEALIFLGEIPNPVTRKKEENIEQARYIIDMLSVLKEKTKGNLNSDEANALDNMLYELRTKFIEKSK